MNNKLSDIEVLRLLFGLAWPNVWAIITICEMPDVTHILTQIESGDPLAAEQLLPLVYHELRQLAARELHNEPSGNTPQSFPTCQIRIA